jgi:hypothetical protein
MAEEGELSAEDEREAVFVDGLIINGRKTGNRSP